MGYSCHQRATNCREHASLGVVKAGRETARLRLSDWDSSSFVLLPQDNTL
jgi:hypothetical protein